MSAAAPADPQRLVGLARGGALSLAGAVVSAGVNLGLTVLITHGLSRSRAGEFFAVTSVFLTAEVLCRLGADVGLVYFFARWRALGRLDLLRSGLRSALTWVLAVSVAVAIVLFVWADPIARLVRSGGDGPGVLRVLAVLLPGVVAYDLCLGATRGFARMRPTVFIDRIGRPVLQLVLVAVVLALGWRGGVGVAWAVPYAACVVAGVVAVRALPWTRAAAGAAVPAPPVPAVTRAEGTGSADTRTPGREFWAFTAPRAVAGVAQVLLQRLDIILVAALRGPADAAVYTAATRFLVVGQFVNQAFAAPAQPRLSALLAVGDRAGAEQVYRASTAWLVATTWPLYCVIGVLAPSYLGAFGSGYADGLRVVYLLCAAMLVASMVGFVDVVLLMAGRTRWNLATTVSALALNVGLDLVLIPHLGIVGAAVGWCAAILATNVVPLAIIARTVRISPFGRGAAVIAVLAPVCFVGVPLLCGPLFAHEQVGRSVGVVLGLGAYAAGLHVNRRSLHLDLALAPLRRPASWRRHAQPGIR